MTLSSLDGYLLRLQQFWLDAVATLTALLESTETGESTPEKVLSATRTALYLMGNAYQQMSQERWKKLIRKLNPLMKFTAEDSKSFVSFDLNIIWEGKGNEKAKRSLRESFSGYHS